MLAHGGAPQSPAPNMKTKVFFLDPSAGSRGLPPAHNARGNLKKRLSICQEASKPHSGAHVCGQRPNILASVVMHQGASPRVFATMVVGMRAVTSSLAVALTGPPGLHVLEWSFVRRQLTCSCRCSPPCGNDYMCCCQAWRFSLSDCIFFAMPQACLQDC